MKKRIKEMLGILLFFIFIMPRFVSADEITYSVSPVFNDNQIETVSDYFDMSVSAGNRYEMGVKVTNQDNVAHDYQVTVENAFSNRNGIIEYTAEEMTYHQVPAIRTIATVEEKIRIEANSEAIVPITLSLPETSFEGTSLGGIRVRKTDDKETNGQIVNRYSYMIPLKIHQGKQEYPEQLGYKGAKLQLEKYDSNLEVIFENEQPVILKGMNVEIKMKRLGKKQAPVQTLYQDEIKMAPETVSHMLLRLDQEEINAGKYQVTIHAKGKEFDQTWTEELEVKAAEAKTINENIGIPKKSPSKVGIFVLIIGVLLMIIIGQMIIMKRRRGREEKK